MVVIGPVYGKLSQVSLTRRLASRLHATPSLYCVAPNIHVKTVSPITGCVIIQEMEVLQAKLCHACFANGFSDSVKHITKQYNRKTSIAYT